jgi:NitT/TauT family transport system substrate-binding protein
VRVIAAQWTGASDFFWYVRADSPIRSLADAAGKTIGFSTVGSSSHLVILSMLEEAKVKARPTATGGTPATLTQVMSGQIDIGWSVASVGMQDVEKGEIRIIARGSDAKNLQEQTTRVTITSAEVLAKRRDALDRFMRAYQKTLDWAYTDPRAIEWLAKDIGIPAATLKKAVAEHYPKSGMSPAPIRGIELSMQQAVELKRLTAPLSPEQINELFVPLAASKN